MDGRSRAENPDTQNDPRHAGGWRNTYLHVFKDVSPTQTTMQQRLRQLLAGSIGQYRHGLLRPMLMTQRVPARYFACNKLKNRKKPQKPVHPIDEVSRTRLDRPEVKLAQPVDHKDRPKRVLRLAMKDIEKDRFDADYALQKACYKSGDKVKFVSVYSTVVDGA